jgi:ATP-binding cassette subfamily F protein 3
MALLQIRNLSKQYGSKILFQNVDVNLEDRSRIALIGPNGAGKSTLIQMIMGHELTDEGMITLHPGAVIGHLAQELPHFSDRTILEEAMQLDGRREEVLKLKAKIEAQLETQSDPELLNEYSKVLEQFDAFDEYRLPSRAAELLEGVGFQKSDFNRNLNEFSGGWKMRVALARILLMQPNLLILDEPTNHLDLESLLWLEEFLQNYPGAILVVSHDRAFLNRLVQDVWEIDQKKIVSYHGNLDAFVTQKEERLKVLEAQFEGQQAKVAEIRAFVERFGAKASKAKQAQSRLKQLEKMDLIEIPDQQSTVHFRFPSCQPSGKEVVTLKNAGIRFGQKQVFAKCDWLLRRGTKVAIVGVNGAGKTTLLKALADQIPFTDGVFQLGHQVQIGYYSQLQAETLNLNLTILEELEATAPKMTLAEVRGVAGAFLFTGESVHKKIRVLSGGEKARVALARLLLQPHNFLLLDEPTNHLDAESREVLLNAIQNYTGTVCLVSHDRDFVGPLVDELLEIDQGQVHRLICSYDEYVLKKTIEAKDRMKGPVKRNQNEARTADTAKNPAPSRTSPSNNQIQYWKKEIKNIVAEISKIERRQSEINDQLLLPETLNQSSVLNDLIHEQTKNQLLLDQKLNRWEELSILLEPYDAD